MRDGDHIVHQGFGVGGVGHLKAHDNRFGEGAQEEVAQVGFVVEDGDDFARLSEVIDDRLFVDTIADLKVGFEDDTGVHGSDGKAVALEGLDGSKEHLGGITARQIGGDRFGLVDTADKFDGSFGGEIVEEIGVGKEAVKPEVLDLFQEGGVVDTDAAEGIGHTVEDITGCKLFDLVEQTGLFKSVLVGEFLEDAQGAWSVVVKGSVEVKHDQGIASLLTGSFDLL